MFYFENPEDLISASFKSSAGSDLPGKTEAIENEA